MAYTPFDPAKPFEYKLTQWPLNDRKGWSWMIPSDTTLEDFEGDFAFLMKDVPECQFEVHKVQNGQTYWLDLATDRELMVLIKETNNRIRPTWYTVIAFDRETGKGNWSEGTYETIEEAKWRVEEINARDGEDAPIMRINARESEYSMCYQFLDDLDRELVRSWGLED